MTDEYKFIITGKDATKRAFLSIRKNLAGVRAGVNSTQVKMVALAGAAGMGALIAKSLQTGDALAKTSGRLRIATEKMAGLQHAAELTGTSQEALDMGLQRMVRRLGQVAAIGSGEAKVALDQLGISIDELRGRKPDEQFALIAEKMKGVADQGEKIFITQKLFDSEGVKLLNLLDQGADGIGEMIQEAKDLGIAMSRLDLAKMEEANNEMLRAKKRIDGIGNQLTVGLAPIIAEVARQFTNAGVSSEEMTDIVEKGVRIGAGVVGTFADGIRGVNVLLKAAEVVARGFGAAFVGSVDLIQTAIFKFADTIKQSLILPFKGWIEIAALVPGVSDKANAALDSINKTLAAEWKPPAGVHETFVQLTEGLAIARTELQELMLQDLPSAVIDQKLGEVLALAEARAGEIARKAQLNLESSQSGGGEDSGPDAKDQERIQAKLDRLNESYLTEFGMLELKYANEQALLEEALAAKQLTDDQFQANQLRATKKFETEKSKLEKKAADAKKAIQGGTLKSIASIVGSENKKMFKIQKAASIAQTAVSLPAAVLESFKNAGGFPWGIAPAAAMAAEGVRQIASIKSASFGGGGGGMSVGGGGGISLPSFGGGNNQQDSLVADNNQTGKQVVIQVIGDVFAQDSDTFAEKLISVVQNHTEADGILFASGTAQAEVLGG